MINRLLTEQIKKYLSKFPIVTITGVRQSGKSTLLRNEFREYNYVSLEDPDIREFAVSDPRGFLNNYKTPCILDEAQRVPELFSYLQTIVDESGNMGEYILSGSHNFLLMQRISQSLAGRSAILTMAPLSLSELKKTGYVPSSIESVMLKGFYPALYSRDIAPNEYFPSYIQTYIERDVRLLRNIPDANNFIRFIKLLAARSGQVINRQELSSACGISVPTVREWLSILMQSFVVYELPPYYNNFSKRLIKSPKLYFYDTGLLCHMLNIYSENQLSNHSLKGAIFETMMVSEYMKSCYFHGHNPNAYYWRDTNQNEVDLLTENTGELIAYEIKSSTTMKREHLKALIKFAEVSKIPLKSIFCIYAGDKSYIGEQGSFIRYMDAFQ